MFALEKYLLKKGGLILHSSFIEWHNQGIVFTAPSGTGKSTQASLWQKYEHAKIINSDRSILYFNKNNILMSCGLPFCGSSNINLNKEFPLKAIVFYHKLIITKQNILISVLLVKNYLKNQV